MTAQFPTLPSHVPHQGSKWSKKLFSSLFSRQGWQIKGDIPNIPKAIAIVAPHTSNIDGWFTFLAVLGLGLKVTIMAKHSLFKPPFAQWMRRFGMIPVNRDHPDDLLERLQHEIHHHDRIWIAVAPEGTRKHAQKWKSGFYRIAQTANIPIIMIALDYQNKTIRILGTFSCTGDYEQDLNSILQHYRGNFSAKHTDQLSDPLR